MLTFSIEPTYKHFLKEVKEKVKASQIKAMVTVNQQLLFMYWEIGMLILERQKQHAWGTKVLEQLAKDLKKSFPDMKGFSRRNLLYMRKFAHEYPSLLNVQPVVAQISWSHNVRLLDLCSTKKERFWYAQKVLENGWSKNVMVMQIEAKLYERSGKAITNFQEKLPPLQSDLAEQVMKDPYILDFLNLREDALEREIEDAIEQHITKFLLELGVGFAFVGRQYKIEIGSSDFYIDLLFYHLKLRCYVAIEFKAGKFKPEYAGKMNFYLNALDDLVKIDADQPSIGIILCKDKNDVMAEYALRGINKPIGISSFNLNEAMPEAFKSQLPTIEELEQELKDVHAED